MNNTQYDQFKKTTYATAPVSVSDLWVRVPRTLLYGYTSGRTTWHVYLGHDFKIHAVEYLGYPAGALLSHLNFSDDASANNEALIPDKRLYPESCDFEFCELLAKANVSLPFTTFTEGADDKRTNGGNFAGLTLEDLKDLGTVRVTAELLGLPFDHKLVARALAQAAQDSKTAHLVIPGGAQVLEKEAQKITETAIVLLNAAKEFMPNFIASKDGLETFLRVDLGVYDALCLDIFEAAGTMALEFSTETELTREYVAGRLGEDCVVAMLGKKGLVISPRSNDGTPLRVIVAQQIGGNNYRFFEHQLGNLEAFLDSMVHFCGVATSPAKI